MEKQSFQRIIASMLEFETPAEESAFCQHVLREVQHHRFMMGWEKDRVYRPGSFLHRLDVAQKKYEQDYEYRRTVDLLFAESNLALNPILTQINQHSDKLSNDLLSGPKFFSVKPQGSEDQVAPQPQPMLDEMGQPMIGEDGQPIMAPPPPNPWDAFKERLHYRSTQIDLHEVGKDGAKGAFIRGQEVVLTSFSTNAYEAPKKISVIKVDGKVVKDTRGVPVLDEDKWVPNPLNMDEIVLERELDLPVKTILPADAVMVTGNPKVIMQYVQDDPGAASKVVYYSDFFTVLNAESLDSAYIKGHAFRANAGDLVMAYPPESRLPAAAEYLDMARRNQLAPSTDNDYTVLVDAARRRDGEDEDGLETQENQMECGFRRRSYYHVIIRYDADKNGIPESIYCIIDVAQQRLLHYEYADFVFPWIPGKDKHPYDVFRIFPKLGRWTGTGWYDLLEVWEEVVDRNLNRIEIDSATSGNIFFENPLATVQGIDGEGVQFRTRTSMTLRGSFTADDAFQTKTVEPANVNEFSMLMERFLSRIELTGGSTSPQDSSVADVPGSDTLGVAKILENTANQSLRAREAEIITSLTRVLHHVADIEAWASLEEATQPFVIKQLGPEKAQVMIDWLKQVGKNYRETIEVNLSKSSSTQMVEQARAIITTMMEWMNIPSAYKPQFFGPFLKVLTGLDDPNPDDTLNLAKSQQADREMALAAAATQPPPR